MADRSPPRSPPAWKQAFDAFDRHVAPRLNQFARSEEFATMAALNKRSQVELGRRLEQLSRRTLHVLNLPAGSDVNRLLTHIAHLEREVRELRKEISDRQLADPAADPAPPPALPQGPTATAKGAKRASSARSGNRARTNPS